MKLSSKVACNSRSGGCHLGELLAAWWQVLDIDALNLSLASVHRCCSIFLFIFPTPTLLRWWSIYPPSFFFYHTLDGLWSENRGSVNRLPEFGRQIKSLNISFFFVLDCVFLWPYMASCAASKKRWRPPALECQASSFRQELHRVGKLFGSRNFGE